MKIFNSKSFLKIISAIILINAIVLTTVYFSGHSFVFWGDQMQECIQLYTNFYNDFRNLNLSLWDFSIGLGTRSTAYLYTVGSALSSYLFLLLPKASYIPYFFPIVNLIRSLVLAFLAWYYFYLIHNKESFGGCVGTILIAFSSFTLFFTNFPYFADFIVYTLLLMIGAEYILKGKNPLFFILACALSSIANLYCIYMNCWFMLIYFTFRLFMIHNHLTLKIYLSYFLKVFIYLLIGIGLTAFILLPNIESVLINNRLGGGEFHFIISPIDMFARFSQLISPIRSDYDYNVYLNAFNKGITTPIPYFFISVIFIYSVFLSFNCNFKSRSTLLIAIAFTFFSSFFPLFNFIFNGSNDIRWSYFFTITAIVFISFVLNEKWNKKEIIKSTILTILYILLITITSNLLKLHSELNTVNYLVNSIILMTLLVIFSLSHIKRKHSICLLIIGVEMFYSFSYRYISFAGFETEDKYTYNNEMYAINNNEGIKFIQNIDTHQNEYYRIDVQKNDFTNYNDALMHNYHGYNSYLSVTNFYLNDYIARHYSTDHFINTDGTKTLAKQLTGMRFCINYGNSVIGDDLELLHTGEFNAYQVVNPINLGYATKNDLSIEYVHSLPSFYQDYLSQYYTIKNSNNTTIDSKHTLEQYSVTTDNNYIDLKDKSMKYMVVDYSLTNKHSNVILEFYDTNGQSIGYKEICEYGYTVQEIPQDAIGVYVYCINSFNINETIDCNVFLLDKYKLDKSEFISEFDSNLLLKDEIQSSISLPEDAHITTIIAYDPNWKVYDNGSIIPTYKCNDGFVGFDLSKGEHHVTFKYQPNFFLPTIITGLCLFALGVVLVNYRKEKESRI